MSRDHDRELALLTEAVHELRNALVPALERVERHPIDSSSDESGSHRLAAARGIQRGLAVADKIAAYLREVE